MRNWLLLEAFGVTDGMGGGNTTERVDATDALEAVRVVCDVPVDSLTMKPWGKHAVLVNNREGTVCVLVVDMGPSQP